MRFSGFAAWQLSLFYLFKFAILKVQGVGLEDTGDGSLVFPEEHKRAVPLCPLSGIIRIEGLRWIYDTSRSCKRDSTRRWENP